MMWSRDLSWNFHKVCNFLVESSTFKQAIKLTFRCNKFGKRAVKIYRPEYLFRKIHVIKLIKLLTDFIYQKVSPVQGLNSFHAKKLVNNINYWITAICVCTLISNFKYRSVKMFLLKIGSELPNLVKKFQTFLKIWANCSQNFYEVEYFHAVACTAASYQKIIRYFTWWK